ncbi:MAG: valine--tRNA ligase [Crocinitomicaceae bacterium]|nr:MAG: valine--tRNA ligase [Crocinitomicaceae bacterium]
MEVSKTYDPAKAEDKWYAKWIEADLFKSKPDDRDPYTVVIPPPNVTGVLHMGHMLNNTIQDVLVRRARMLGKNACWVPGTDHASIATEAKVVQKLRSEGIKKSDLSRDKFLEHAWEWTNKHGGIILEQLKKLGASCDWDRTTFTMDDNYYNEVINVFCDLHDKGFIYRGERMINWDPDAKTALSDEEVFYKEVNSKLYYVRYKIKGSEDEWIQIATTRPETILGDSAICINPNDDRYSHLAGKEVLVPLINRTIPIIFDDYVDMDFGTGCLKITPAHDPNDYEIGKKHNLEVINILNPNGTLNQNAKLYVGEDRFEVRKKIAHELHTTGYLIKEEDHINKIGFSERTDAVIEPRLSLQWFCAMEKLSKPALENVMNNTIQFHPEKFKNTYKHWMENIRDWCISRQLWWGHRIPAYYFGEGKDDFIVAQSIDEALEKLNKQSDKNYTEADLKQDEDVMDTWFSSWIWPIAVFNGFNKNEEIDYYYPTNDLVTAPEIMFFWVARMIISGYEYKEKPPFKNVYFTGIVRDKLGRKMSKSLGNSPDPLELIEKYGADGVRVGMLLSSPAGNDLLFDSALCEQGRNFTNKIWNSYRLISSWSVSEELKQENSSEVAIQWFKSKFNENLTSINESYNKFRISEALMSTYKTVWDDFCSWYLEMIKPAYGHPIDKQTYEETIGIFDKILKLVYPFTPFISEEIWQLIEKREESSFIVNEKWPENNPVDDNILKQFTTFKDVVSGIRNIRKENNIANKVLLDFNVRINNEWDNLFNSLIIKLGNIKEIKFVDSSIKGANSFVVNNNEFFIPFSKGIDLDAEMVKVRSELDDKEGFLKSVMKKLDNEKFMANAPQKVVDMELKKKSDAENQIQILKERLIELSSL